MPTPSERFKNVALRDIALHEKHAACVDAMGDVYQWGDGFLGGEPGRSHTLPQLTLKGKVCGSSVSQFLYDMPIHNMLLITEYYASTTYRISRIRPLLLRLRICPSFA